MADDETTPSRRQNKHHNLMYELEFDAEAAEERAQQRPTPANRFRANQSRKLFEVALFAFNRGRSSGSDNDNANSPPGRPQGKPKAADALVLQHMVAYIKSVTTRAERQRDTAKKVVRKSLDNAGWSVTDAQLGAAHKDTAITSYVTRKPCLKK